MSINHALMRYENGLRTPNIFSSYGIRKVWALGLFTLKSGKLHKNKINLNSVRLICQNLRQITSTILYTFILTEFVTNKKAAHIDLVHY
jgi:hypothetical protein